jgi:hypothetical protein
MNKISIFGGPVTLWQVDASGRWSPQASKPRNLTMFAAADIIARLLAGQTQYRPAAMYFEFTNTGAGAPTPLQDEGYSYYAGLAGSGDYDYLRVPIDISPTLEAEGDDYLANKLTFAALTAGSTGVHGSTFSHVASQVIGVALVATPTDDAADDIVYARRYFDTAITKVSGQQIGVTWPLTFTAPE